MKNRIGLLMLVGMFTANTFAMDINKKTILFEDQQNIEFVSFKAENNTISAGESTLLTWIIKNNKQIDLYSHTQPKYTVTDVSNKNELLVSPTQDARYILDFGVGLSMIKIKVNQIQ